MTMTEPQKLPRKLSDLILVALVDLAKAERAKRYLVQMNAWHEPVTLWAKKNTPVCEVCLAGVVMAFSLETPVTQFMTPSQYPDYVEQRLNALNNILSGDVFKALRRLNTGFGVLEHFVDLFPMPIYGPSAPERRAFKAGLCRIVRALQKHGL